MVSDVDASSRASASARASSALASLGHTGVHRMISWATPSNTATIEGRAHTASGRSSGSSFDGPTGSTSRTMS